MCRMCPAMCSTHRRVEPTHESSQPMPISHYSSHLLASVQPSAEPCREAVFRQSGARSMCTTLRAGQTRSEGHPPGHGSRKPRPRAGLSLAPQDPRFDTCLTKAPSVRHWCIYACLLAQQYMIYSGAILFAMISAETESTTDSGEGRPP